MVLSHLLHFMPCGFPCLVIGSLMISTDAACVDASVLKPTITAFYRAVNLAVYYKTVFLLQKIVKLP